MAKIDRVMEYSESQIKTAGKLKSIQMLHEGATKFIKESLEEGADKLRLRIKAQNIIAQLQMSLNATDSIEAELVFHIYDYAYRLLETNNDEDAKNASMLFEHLTNTFKMIRH